MFINRYDLETTLNSKDIEILAPSDEEMKATITKAISTIKSYIQHRYNPDEIFITPIEVFSLSTTYAIDEVLRIGSIFYTCILESTGNELTDTTYFTEGDTRDPSIVDICTILTIYYLFRKVQPRNIPDWITDEYDKIVKDLISYQKGTRMIELPVKLDDDDEEEGHRITYGSETAKDWNI